MQECKFCNGTIKDEDVFCKACGYDPKTDRISPDFVSPPGQPLQPTKEDSTVIARVGISPGVKKFALIALAILIFSIFYKNHFSISNVVAEARYVFTMISKGNFKIWEDKSISKKIEYIDVRTFEDHQSRRD
ncbi:hypothetical protein ACFL2J_07850 [Candidatus Omnitrophota bacterium]